MRVHGKRKYHRQECKGAKPSEESRCAYKEKTKSSTYLRAHSLAPSEKGGSFLIGKSKKK